MVQLEIIKLLKQIQLYMKTYIHSCVLTTTDYPNTPNCTHKNFRKHQIVRQNRQGKTNPIVDGSMGMAFIQEMNAYVGHEDTRRIGGSNVCCN